MTFGLPPVRLVADFRASAMGIKPKSPGSVATVSANTGFLSQRLGPLVAKYVAQVRGFASEFRDMETPRNPRVVSKSQNLRLLQRTAFGDASAASIFQMAPGDMTVGCTPIGPDDEAISGTGHLSS